MKVIIAGSRTITDPTVIEEAIKKSGFHITEVVCGGAKGVDDLGRKWAGDRIPVKMFPANWDLYGRVAGFKRNWQMGDYADALIAVWDGISRGTFHMINIAKKKNLDIFVYIVPAWEYICLILSVNFGILF